MQPELCLKNPTPQNSPVSAAEPKAQREQKPPEKMADSAAGRKRTPPNPLFGKATEHESYSTWRNMKARCYTKSNSDFHSYGGRGVRICERWMEFWKFVEDMGPKPTPQHSIDRWPDKNGNYEQSNCRWATSGQQSLNTNRNRFLEYEGRRLSICQWADEKGLSRDVLRERLNRGWTIEKALTLPTIQLGKCSRKLTPAQVASIRTDSMSNRELSELFSVTPDTIRNVRKRRVYADLP